MKVTFGAVAREFNSCELQQHTTTLGSNDPKMR